MYIVVRYIIGVLIGILTMIGIYSYKDNNTPIEEPTVRVDTLHITSVDTVFVPVEKIKYEYSRIIDTIYLSSLDSVLLVEQKEYKDTISTIWISGVKPKIDSIEYKIPRDTFFIDREITIREQKRTNKGLTFNIGLGAGVGYNPITGKIEPTIGIQGTIGYGFCISKKR